MKEMITLFMRRMLTSPFTADCVLGIFEDDECQ